MKRYKATVGADSRNGDTNFRAMTGISRSTQGYIGLVTPLLDILSEDAW